MASSIGYAVSALSDWIDSSYPEGIDPELHLRRRVGKLMEEVGEAGQALGGMTGENPRKGFTHTAEDLSGELLDVAITALGAWEHLDGNQGNSENALLAKLNKILVRAVIEGAP